MEAEDGGKGFRVEGGADFCWIAISTSFRAGLKPAPGHTDEMREP